MLLYVDIVVINLYTHLTISPNAEMIPIFILFKTVVLRYNTNKDIIGGVL